MGLLKLNPFIYWVVGVVAVVGAVFMYLDAQKRDEARIEALASPPPTAVALEDFDRARDANGANEVVIDSRLDLNVMYTLTREKSGVITEERFMAPLRATNATGAETEIHAVLLEDSQDLDVEQIDAWSLSSSEQGGLLVQLHGVLMQPSSGVRGQVVQALDKHGLTLASDVVFIDPFLADRSVELKQTDEANIAAGAGVGGVLIFVYGFIRRRFARGASAA